MTTSVLPLSCLCALATALTLSAQNLLPNPGFADGDTAPVGWRLTGCAGEWRAEGANRALAVTGDGTDSGYWRTPELALKAGGLYALHFRARRLPGASGGSAIAGTSRVNRDFRLDADWRDYRFFFRQPDNGAKDFVRLGQWHVKGGIEFDDVELLPALANVSRLGEAESVRNGVYRFSPNFGWRGANFHPPLDRCTASFNSDRWVFSTGSEVIYRFELDGVAQTNAQVSVAINYHQAGRLHVEASTDGKAWTSLATFDGEKRRGTCDLPASMFPAKEVFVRLRAADPGTSLQVNRCDYEAQLDGAEGPGGEGQTTLAALEVCDPRLEVDRLRLSTPSGQGLIQLDLAGSSHFSRNLEVEATFDGPTVRSRGNPAPRTLRPGDEFAFTPSVIASAPGDHELRFTLRARPDRIVLKARTVAHLSSLHDPRTGHFLSKRRRLALWWCESGWKVARDSRPPETTAEVIPVNVSAARGESEAAQLLVWSEQEQELAGTEILPLRRADGFEPGIRVQLHELAYVQVATATDNSCEPDWYPDPLPPLEVPLKLGNRINQPIWLSFYAPRETPPGDYSGKLILKIAQKDDLKTIEVPLAVHVYDFELPRESHLRSAFGLGTGNLNRYHKLTRREDRIAVFEKYLQNFAEHRISPYSFFDYAPIRVSFEGEGADKHARVDFTEFDRWAERWLDGKRPASGEGGDGMEGSPFNTFRLPLRGMGGGTFHSRHLGELEGFQEGTPEHARLFQDYLSQVEAHLREKGWLDKAFTYWFDEPDPKDYDFVVAGQERIKAAAPGLKRMLTEQPEPALLGHVDIWCGLTPHWTPETVRARREAGEEVWWYICTGPKAPYVTEFIDHPGTELRLWPWQSWQYGVTGILVWATTYWTSPLAYPDSLQDPWKDPMSWVSGYGRPVGTRSPWGNGDGRFLYPPRRDPNTATEPCLDGPISSIRWENLRDGMEDYEYFWLLDQEVKRLEALKQDALAPLLAEARALLVVPEEVSKDLTHFTTDPRTMLAHRDKIARMIERLQRR